MVLGFWAGFGDAAACEVGGGESGRAQGVVPEPQESLFAVVSARTCLAYQFLQQRQFAAFAFGK